VAEGILIAFPFTGTLVGGSYHSAALLAGALEQRAGIRCAVLLPREGPNSAVFQANGLTPEYYGLSEKHVILMRHTESILAKLRALGAYRATYLAALRWLRSNRPSIVHINDDRTMLDWGMAAKRLGIPVVWHVRQRTGSRLLDRVRLQLADYLIFLAEDARRHRFRERQLQSKPHCVIYNAVDTSVFYPPPDRSSAKAALGVSPKSIVLCYLGNLTPRKRPEWVVEAGISLLQEGLDVEVLVVGHDRSGGQLENALKERVERAGCADSFHFLGYRSDVAEILRAVDILGMPSIAEPFGRVVIEAMASGVVVVATNAGGVPEIIQDGVNGMLVPSHDFTAFVSAIRKLCLDPALRDALSMEGIRTVQKRFSVDTMVEQVLEVYRELLQRDRK